MIVDGKTIAQDIFSDLQQRISALDTPPHLTVIICKPNFETKKFLSIKKQRAEEVGITMNVVELAENVTTDECITAIKTSTDQTNGIIIQLPFPEQVDKNELLKAVPETHDVDGLNQMSTRVLSPVVGAIKEILERSHIDIDGKKVAVIGNGALVGRPSAKWFTKHGAEVTVVTKDSASIIDVTKNADIVVLGVGEPGILKADMVKEGVILFDAGTSEESGELRGDADPACAKKASLFTPVPGGIGPITIAVLLRNLLLLTEK